MPDGANTSSITKLARRRAARFALACRQYQVEDTGISIRAFGLWLVASGLIAIRAIASVDAVFILLGAVQLIALSLIVFRSGEIELMGDDIGGIAVHIGARVCVLAGPGEVLVTSTVRDLVAGSGLSFVEHGRHTLKGVPGEWTILAVQE